jgi:REP element-mobilizing transposase RayT
LASRVYVLLTWTTRERQPLVTSQVEALLTRLLPRIARAHQANTLALGMVPDHVHMVLRLPLQIDIPRLVQALKGASSRIANRDHVADPRLAWANGYDLRSISVRALADVRAYVRNQKLRHGIVQVVAGSRPPSARARA